MSLLSYTDVLKTFIYEVGLGLIALSFSVIVPRLKQRANATYDSYSWKRGIESHVFSFIFQYPYFPTITLSKRTEHFKTWILWEFLQGSLFTLALAIPTFELLTSVGWRLPFFLNLSYNILFATANGQPNGAHITSYLCVMFLMLFATYKTRDVFLGILSGALLVGLHELIWVSFFYESYFVYLRWFMLPNVLKDFLAFIPMCFLFIIAFAQYPLNRWRLKDFSIPIILYATYVFLWAVVPSFFGMGYLPARTLNLPGSPITFGSADATKYFMSPIVSGIEIFSWFLLSFLIGAIIGKK